MQKLPSGLLAQIEMGALESRTPLADTLRKCVALGGHSGSKQLRDWANQELHGYKDNLESLPSYRIVPAVIAIDGQTRTHQITGQQISSWDLPDFARDTIKPEAPLVGSVAELARLSAKDETIRMQHPGMQDLVYYMNADDAAGNVISALYWKVNSTHVHGVLETIRTMLVSLVAEMRETGSYEQPSAESVNNAVNVVVHGVKRSTINVNTNQVSATGGDVQNNQSMGHEVATSTESGLPMWIRGPWSFAVGAASILAAAVGVAVWAGWNPFS